MPFSKRQRQAQAQQPHLESFILEPILTPSGLVDGSDDGTPDVDLAPDVLLADVDEWLPEDFEASYTAEPVTEDLLPLLDFIEPIAEEVEYIAGVFTVGESGEVQIDFLFDGGKYQGELAIFSLEGMEAFEPGSEAFIEEAANRALSDSELGHVVISDRSEGARFSGSLGERNDWNAGDYQGVKSFQMRPGDRFAAMLVPNGTVADVAENPSIGGAKQPIFSLATANPNDNLHFGQIADVTGDGSTFVLEDVQYGHKWYDEDYNDLIFQVRGASGDAPYMGGLISPDADWRGTDLGQALIEYAKPYITPGESGGAAVPLPPNIVEPEIPIPEPPILPGLPDPEPGSPIAPPQIIEVDESTSTMPVPEARTPPGVPVPIPDAGLPGDNPIYNPPIDDLLPPNLFDNYDLPKPPVAEVNPSLPLPEASLPQPALPHVEVDLDLDELSTGDDEVALPTAPVKPAIAPKRFEFPRESQPLVGIIDTGFSANNPDLDYSRITLGRDWVDGDDNPLLAAGEGNEHGTHVLGIIAAKQNNGIGIDGINDDAPIWLGRAIGSGKWAESLVEFVDAARESGQPNAVANLSLDLTQVDAAGNVTTRYEFTPMEMAALEYARQNKVLVMVAAGNDGGVMSALGQASQQFDNIMTVGAAERIDGQMSAWKGFDRAEYSSYGNGLDIVAEVGTLENPTLSTIGDGVGAMDGTSVATAKLTGAASQVWAANPQLSYRQVIDILKSTATDLKSANPDLKTGAGLVNLVAAVHLAKATQPKEQNPELQVVPMTWSGEGRVTPMERAVRYRYEMKAGDTLWSVAYRELGDGSRWTEITKDADGSLPFTNAELTSLPIGQVVYIPGSNPQSQPQSQPSASTPNQVKLADFLQAFGNFTSPYWLDFLKQMFEKFYNNPNGALSSKAPQQGAGTNPTSNIGSSTTGSPSQTSGSSSGGSTPSLNIGGHVLPNLPRDRAGNSRSTALDLGTLSVGTKQYSDWVGSSDTDDYYKFTLDHTAGITANLTGLSANADLQLLRSDGSSVKLSRNPGTQSETISLINSGLGPGTYYLRVYPGDGASNTSYNLSLAASPLGDLNDSLSQAPIIENIVRITGNSGTWNNSTDLIRITRDGRFNSNVTVGGGGTPWVSKDTRDYYQFSLTDTRDISVGLWNLQADANLSLLDSNGRLIRSSSQTGNAPEVINGQRLGPGKYYIRVDSADNRETEYRLTLRKGIPVTDWKAEYFTGATPGNGTPVWVENFGSGNGFSKDWGNKGPTGTDYQKDNFSVRVTTQRSLPPGLYKLSTKADDGVRVRIGNQTVIDRWNENTGANAGFYRSDGQTVPITIDYFENGGNATLDFDIQPVQKFEDSVPWGQWGAIVFHSDPRSGNPPPADFWKDDMRNPNAIGRINLGSGTRSDGKPGINFDWSTGAPNNDRARLPQDHFAIRAYTQAHFDGGEYKFRVRADDGYQILAKKHDTHEWFYITPKDAWQHDYGSHREITYQLPAGDYDVHFHMYEGGGNAYLDLSWENAFEPTGLPTTTSQAEPFFKLQYRHHKYNPRIEAGGTYNCGPTSVAMIMKFLGKEPPGISVETSIDHARHLMQPYKPYTIHEGVKVLNQDKETTNWADIRQGIASLGKQPVDGNSWEDIDHFISEGKPMVAYGFYDDDWRRQFPSYQESNSNIGHFIAIFGKTPTGKYIVSDPVYGGGPVEMSKEQLGVFWDARYGIKVFAAS